MTDDRPAPRLDGPWWLDHRPFRADREAPPQEALFRVRFAGGGAVRLHLAAVDQWQLWLDGRWQGCGPARAPHGALIVDTFALDPAGAGEHEIAIQVLWEGLFGWASALAPPGLHLGLERAGAPLAYELLVSARSGRRFTHRFSQQRGWNEDIDHRARAHGWPVGPWRAADWSKPVRRRGDPRQHLEWRDIAPLRHDRARPALVAFAGACDPSQRTPHRPLYYEDAPGMGDAADGGSAARLIQEEALLPARARDRNLAGLVDGGAAELGPDARGRDRTVQLDLGREVAGLQAFTVEAPAGTVLDLGWSEGWWRADHAGCWAGSGQPDGSVAPRELCDARQGLRHVCAGGAERVEGLFIVAARHLRLAARLPRGVRAPVRIRDLHLRTVGYPLAREGAFRCSDDLFNRVWDAAAATLECSVADIFMDCPGRERGGWLNDAYWMAEGMQAVSADTAYERRFLSLFTSAGSTRPGRGMVAPLYPSDYARWRGGAQRPITGHGLFWLLQTERHLRWHGNDALARAWLPTVEGLVAALARHRDRRGLLTDPPWDHFADWSHYRRGPVQTIDNVLYALALQRAGRCFRRADWRRQGAATWAAIDAAAWDEGRGLWCDVPGHRDAGQVTSLVTLWSGLADAKRTARAWGQLRPLHPLTCDRPRFDYETAQAQANAMGLPYRFAHAGRIGDLACLRQDLAETCLPQFARGQSCLGEHLGHQSSLCHGYNGHLAALLSRWVGGIELPEDRDGPVVIAPHPDALAWCQARVPWRGGHVQVWWDRHRLLASLPAGVRGAVRSGGRLRAFRGTVELALAR